MPIQFDSMGREIPDPTPMELAPGLVRPESLQSMMQRMIRQQLSQYAVDQGEESFDEANDFEIEDEDFDDITTKYEEMGVEPGTAEREDGPATGGDVGQAEPSGLRTESVGPAAGSGGLETGPVDRESGVSPDPSLRSPVRESVVAAPVSRAPVQRRGNGQEGG